MRRLHLGEVIEHDPLVGLTVEPLADQPGRGAEREVHRPPPGLAHRPFPPVRRPPPRPPPTRAPTPRLRPPAALLPPAPPHQRLLPPPHLLDQRRLLLLHGGARLRQEC